MTTPVEEVVTQARRTRAKPGRNAAEPRGRPSRGRHGGCTRRGQACEAELRGLVERVLAGEEAEEDGCDAWDRWSKDARAWLAAHPVALPKETTADIPETEANR